MARGAGSRGTGVAAPGEASGLQIRTAGPQAGWPLMAETSREPLSNQALPGPKNLKVNQQTDIVRAVTRISRPTICVRSYRGGGGKKGDL